MIGGDLMKKLFKTGFLFILCAFLLVGCSFDIDGINNVIDSVTPKDVTGEMNYFTTTPADGISARKLDFKNISFTGNAKIYIFPSDETKVEAAYPTGLEESGFRIKIREGEIEVSVPKPTNFRIDNFELKVYGNIEEIEISGGIALEMNAEASKKIELDVKGGADAYIYNINAFETEIDIDGAASLNLSGNTDYLELDLSGAGAIDSKSLVCKKAEVKISGAGSASVSVTDELLADVDGVGALEYYGNPVLKNISGGLTDVEQISKEVYGG
ncbi:MAG: DUF2807 domain-containing protein [Ruminococcaceae bacterium]|nr:DUF2807 domain-containing protein [Oscillospiraceae bacterium]